MIRELLLKSPFSYFPGMFENPAPAVKTIVDSGKMQLREFVCSGKMQLREFVWTL